MDIARETDGDDWMTECMSNCIDRLHTHKGNYSVHRINWFRAMAAHDRWFEELQLIKSEFQWTISFFQGRSDGWGRLALSSEQSIAGGPACYAARQAATYARLRDNCISIRMSVGISPEA